SAISMALFAFGLNISTIKMMHIKMSRELFIIPIAKNCLHLLIAVLIGSYLFKLDDYWFYALIISTSAPTAFIVYIIAKQFAIHADFVKVIVAISSITSLVCLMIITQFIT